MLLLQEFDLYINDKKGKENSVADHLLRLHVLEGGDISDTFLDEHLLAISSHAPWYAHIVNFIVTGLIPEALESFEWHASEGECALNNLKIQFSIRKINF